MMWLIFDLLAIGGGATIYLLCVPMPRAAELGRLAFLAGMIALLWHVGAGTVRIWAG